MFVMILEADDVTEVEDNFGTDKVCTHCDDENDDVDCREDADTVNDDNDDDDDDDGGNGDDEDGDEDADKETKTTGLLLSVFDD